MIKNLIIFFGLSTLLLITNCNRVEITEYYSRATKPMVQPISYMGFLDNQTFYTVGGSGAVFYSHDFGKTLTRGKNTSHCLWGLDILSKNQAWACGNNSYVVYTQDGGQTWKNASKFGKPEPNHCRYISFIDSKTGLIASPQLLASTTDSGIHWKQIELPEKDIKISAIFLRTASEAYVFDDFTGKLYITTDTGKTWISKTTGTKAIKKYIKSSPTALIRFEDPQRGVIIFDNFEKKKGWILLRTQNGGDSWEKQELDIEKGYIYLSKDSKIITITDGMGKLKAYSVEGLFQRT